MSSRNDRTGSRRKLAEARQDEALAILRYLFDGCGAREVLFVDVTQEASRRRSEWNWEHFRVLVPVHEPGAAATVRDVSRFLPAALGAHRVARDGWALAVAGGGFDKADDVTRSIERALGFPPGSLYARRL